MRRSSLIGALLAAGVLLLAACSDPETTSESADNRISASEDDAAFEPSETDADPESTSSGTIVTDIGQDDETPVDEPPIDDSAADVGDPAEPGTDTGSAQPSDTDAPAGTGAGVGSDPETDPDSERNPDPEQRTDDAVVVLADAGPPPEDSAAPPAIDADVDADDTPNAGSDERLALDQGSALACAVLEIGRDAAADGDTNRAVTLAERLDENRDRIGDTRIRAVITELAAADRADTDLLDDGLTRCTDLGYETSV